MTLETLLVLLLVVAVFAAFVWEKLPADVIALGASAVLLALGILETQEFLSVFSSSAPITIAMMFIISAALERTGILQILGDGLRKAARGSVLRAMLLMMMGVIIASAFMNNTPVVVMLTPVTISLTNSLKIAPSKMLIPLSFASIFGGTLTLIGTSTNILMSTVAVQGGEPEIGMFEMTLPGLVFASVGLIYMFFAYRFLLPNRSSLAGLIANQPKRKFIAEVLIPRGSKHVGKALVDSSLTFGRSHVLDLIRAGHSQRQKLNKVVLEAGDKLVIKTDAGELVGLKENGQFEFKNTTNGYEPVAADRTVLMEASIGHRSPLIGRRLTDLRLRRKFGIYVLAVHRNDENISDDFDQIYLQFADTLLLEGPADGIRLWLEEGDVVNLSEPLDRPIRRTKAPIALGVIIGVMVLAGMGVMPIAGLAVIGAVVVMVTQCVDPEEAFKSIDWRILFLIFGMLGLSLGMDKTGAAQWIVEIVVASTQSIGPLGILAAVYILTSALTEMVSNNAVAVLIGPIVISMAHQLGLDARPFIMAVMFAASASFATPIGYQTNTFVYGAGGYRFRDFLRVGLPLNVIFAIVAILIIPRFFPF